MTLTSLFPTLRDSLPSPFDPEAWPAHSQPHLDDVTVAAVSLRRYADLCGTPCVCTGPAVIPLSGGIASETDATTVVLMHVVEVTDATIIVDARLDEIDPAWREARLLGRISHAYDARFGIGGADAPTATVVLPGDLRAGDLLAVPCAGYRSVGEVRCAGAVTR